MSDDIVERITAYLSGGGLFNPELANHDAVRDLLIDARAELAAVTAERDRMRGELAAEKALTNACEQVNRRNDELLDKVRLLQEALRPFSAQLDHPGTIYEHDGVRIAVVNQDILDRLCLDARAALEGVTEKLGAGNE